MGNVKKVKKVELMRVNVPLNKEAYQTIQEMAQERGLPASTQIALAVYQWLEAQAGIKSLGEAIKMIKEKETISKGIE